MQELIRQFMQAKEEERRAIEKRVELGNKLAMFVKGPEDGQTTEQFGDYKLSVRRVLNYKVDWSKMNDIVKGQTHVPIKIKQELDEAGLKWIRENDSAYYKKLCDAITSKPGRVQVEVKEIKNV